MASPATVFAAVPLDHVLILADDADALAALFTATFLLPSAWAMQPWAENAVPPVETTGVFAGNLTLEFIRRSPGRAPLHAPPHPAQVLGVGVRAAAALEASLAQLAARGIAHGQPDPGLLWTNVTLPDLLPDHLTFLIRYVPAWYQGIPNWAVQLQARDEGPLGVVGVQEVVFGVQDLAGTAARWEALLGTAEVLGTDLNAQLGPGPSVRLEAAPVTTLHRLVLQVKDLPHAAAFLAAHGLLGEQRDQLVGIAAERVSLITKICQYGADPDQGNFPGP